MKIIISEEQKKKLFVPRYMDEREQDFNDIIKKYLLSIKDNEIWDIIGSIDVQIDEYGDNYLVLDKKDKNILLIGTKKFFTDYLIGKYGYDYNNNLVKNMEDALNNIITYLTDLIELGENDYARFASIINKDDGQLEYGESRVIKVVQNDIRVVKV